MTRGKVHHADAEATFRTVLKPRKEKSCPIPKEMDSFKEASENIKASQAHRITVGSDWN